MAEAPFFVAGGTVPPDSPSYVERGADRELFEALLAGEFCFVLNSRQMGKSSLAVRTIARLNETGVRTAFVDLTRLGATGADPERWYASLLIEFGRALGLRAEAMAYVRANPGLTPAGRLFGFLADEVLNSPLPSGGEGLGVRGEGQPLVVFIDEVDATRTLPFSADDLFAGLRQAWNARAESPAYRRLAFCLMGAALPSDLIRDPRVTPFNVGRRVDLRDFTPEEARPFASQVGELALARVLYWTGGHPFLTQALCAAVASPSPSGSSWRGGRGEREVDALVRSRYLDARARDTDTNLADVGNRLLGAGDPDMTDDARAAVLTLYERVLKGKPVPDDESNPAAARIKMSGVARVENGLLKVRNRIYREAFDARWVRDNMPGGELRRQKKAFYRGVLRTGLVSAAVIAVVGGLAWNNLRLARLAQAQRDAARYDAYVASMQTTAQKSDEGDGETARRTLESLKDDPSRGWEWDYWKRAIDGGSKTLDWRGKDVPKIAAADRGSWLGVADADSLTIYDLQGHRHARVALPHASGEGYRLAAFRSGDRFLIQSRASRDAYVVDAPTGRILRQRRLGSFVAARDKWDSPGDRWTMSWSPATLRTYRLDLGTLEERALPQLPIVVGVVFSPRGDRVALRENGEGKYSVSVRRTSDLHEIWKTRGTYPQVDIDPKGATLAIADDNTVKRVDVETGRVLDSVEFTGTADGVRFAPDGKRLLIERLGEKVQEFSVRDHLRPIRSFYDLRACYAAGERLLTAGTSVSLHDLRPRVAPLRTVLLRGALLDTARIGHRLTFVGARETVELDADAPQRSKVVPLIGTAYAMLDRTGRFALTMPKTKGYHIEDLQRIYPALDFPAPDIGGWDYMAANPRGDRLVLPSDTTHFAVYDTRTRRRIATLGGVSGEIYPQFSDDGRWLAVGDEVGGIGVWDTSTWQCVASARLGRDLIQCLAFSPDGGRVAAGSRSGDLGALDFRQGSIRRLEGISQAIDDVAWSPDGCRLASGGVDRGVRLWDVATGRDLGVIGRHEAEVNTIWFTRDGRTLCSVDKGGTLKLWTAAGKANRQRTTQ